MDMWRTSKGRDELREKFAQHGDFGQLEVYVRKKHLKTASEGVQGGWYTKAALQKEGWTSKMIERAWAWAQTFPPGVRHRVNPVHGEEEIKIVLRETFENLSQDIEEVERCGTFTIQDGDEAGTLLQSDLPDPGDVAAGSGSGANANIPKPNVNATGVSDSDSSDDDLVNSFVQNFADGASAKSVLADATKTEKLLDKHGALSALWKLHALQIGFGPATNLLKKACRITQSEQLDTFYMVMKEEVKVVWQNEHYHFYFRFLGAKGDWPLKTFPRGLGKGSDTGLIGAWLEAVLDSVTEDSIPVRCLLC
ncbi:unnamed protein product [Durusdinium trenchii]|uniref:Uncharacterized protein n=1 Tax=Durusdinium trenchii TaxID=1381693 RepID=A0ABP0N221_9DINO